MLLSADLAATDLGSGGAWLRWGTSEIPVAAGSYIVTFDDYVGNAQAELLAREVATRLGVTATDFKSLGRGGWATFQTNDFVSREMAQNVSRAMAGVRAVEPDVLRTTNRVPNDPRLADQYSLINTGQIVSGVVGTPGADISAQQAWDLSIGSRDVIVAVIDTGVDYTHPDLAPNIWVNPGEVAGNGIDDDGNGFVDDIHGYDFGNLDGDPMDDDPADGGGHGTLVSGVIGAVGDNNQGVTGVNWAVSIIGLKVTSRIFQGFLSTAAIIGAHDYCTTMRQRGFNIVASNGSYGAFGATFYADFPDGVDGERAAIQRWLNAGGIFVAAAGNSAFDNDDPDLTNFPSSYNLPGMISVAASDNNDGLAAFSNYGASTVDLAAPGVQVLSTAFGGGYDFVDGTSFSSPTVAGAVALLKSIRPNASAVQIRQAIMDGVDALPSLQGRVVSGGRLNVFRSMQIIGLDGPVVRSVDPGPITTQLDPNTNQVINTITVDFNKTIDNNASFFNTGGVTLTGLGTDGLLGTLDDVVVPISSIARDATNLNIVTIGLNLSSFTPQRLPLGSYRLVLNANSFRDLNGNRLNGNTTSGTDEVYSFRVAATTGDNEPNDSFAQATPVSFDASGTANFSGASVGNGLFANLDVDLYKITLPKGALITAEIFAQRRSLPSTLDSVLRLFNSRGEQIASNDQFFGGDSFIDFFVSTGGVYYVGVSGFGNAQYDPAIAGSGSSQSTGAYDLRLGAQLVSDDIVTYNPAGTQVPRRIPIAESSTQGTTTSQIIVSDSRQIQDVNVHLDISHTFVSDLQISLISARGTEIVLFNRRGADGDNLTSTVFDDEASATIASGSAPFTGLFRPEAALGAFDGQTANGTWTLLIRDQIANNAGVLNSWSLEFTFTNDIFGPFEFNDTISTAKAVQEIQGVGAATRAAFVGDGGFGLFDRDIFSFVADAGSSLTASVASGGTLNSALRLFDASGTQVVVSAPSTSNNAQIDNYVFTVGGTYYLGISENSNIGYDPQVSGPGSGTAAQTTGNYTLTFSVASGVSDATVALAGSSVRVNVGPTGNFAATDSTGARNGIRFGAAEFLPNIGGVVPQHFIGAIAGGSIFLNEGQGNNNLLPFALTSRSDAANQVVTSIGEFRGLRIERVISFGQDDNFMAVDVFMTNVGVSALSAVSWMEGFNPNPGVSTVETVRETNNDVIGRGAYATLTSNTFQQGVTIGLVAPDDDTRAKATIITNGQAPRDPSQLISAAVNDPDGLSSDGQLALSFNVGSLSSGETTRLRYFVMMGQSKAAVTALADSMNDGTGAGHLVADVTTGTGGAILVNTDNPVSEVLSTGAGPTITAPTLPIKLYYPEGFSGPGINTVLRLANPTNQATRIVAIARFEQGARDQVLADLTLDAGSRTAVTLITPDTFANATSVLTRSNAPYAVEIRAERAISATFEHNDRNLTGGSTSTLGESFTTRVSTVWSFGEITKSASNSDFLSFYNTSSTFTKVTMTIYPAAGGTATNITFDLPALRRGGLSIKDLNLPDGTYGAIVRADVPIVAALTSYRSIERTSEGVLGVVGAGTSQGVSPEGQFGLNSNAEQVSVLNTGTSAASVVFSFQLANGSSYRTSLSVPANSYRRLDVSTLANFPSGQPYSIFYESNVPVTVTAPTSAFGGELWGSFADRAFTLWQIGSGFRPAGDAQTQVTEYLRIHNPSNSDTTVEITINYGGTGGSEVFRRTIGSRRVGEFNLDDFITGGRRSVDTFYSVQVKSAKPVVVYSARIDRDNGVVYGSLASPLGITGPVAEPLG